MFSILFRSGELPSHYEMSGLCFFFNVRTVREEWHGVRSCWKIQFLSVKSFLLVWIKLVSGITLYLPMLIMLCMLFSCAVTIALKIPKTSSKAENLAVIESVLDEVVHFCFVSRLVTYSHSFLNEIRLKILLVWNLLLTIGHTYVPSLDVLSS